MQAVLRHRQVGLHFVVQALRFQPLFAVALPHVNVNPPLELKNALLVQLYGGLLLFYEERKHLFGCHEDVFLGGGGRRRDSTAGRVE